MKYLNLITVSIGLIFATATFATSPSSQRISGPDTSHSELVEGTSLVSGHPGTCQCDISTNTAVPGTNTNPGKKVQMVKGLTGDGKIKIKSGGNKGEG